MKQGVAWWLWLLLVGQAAATESAEETLRLRLDAAEVSATSLVGAKAADETALRQLYLDNGFGLIWSDADGIMPRAAELLTLLQNDTLPLAVPQAVDTAALAQAYAQAQQQREEGVILDAAARSTLDLQLTTAALGYVAQHLYGQFTRPERVAADWRSAREGQGAAARLLQATRAEQTLTASLTQLEPTHPAYARLHTAWQDYSRKAALEADAAPLPLQAHLKLGDQAAQVAQLRQRLQVLGDLPATPAKLSPGEESADPLQFDSALAEALKRFQARHGLAATGQLEAKTVAALNVPLAERVQQMALNLERWRWLPQTLGERYILVNIPDFSLEVIAQGEVALAMPVIVGKPANRTPLFSAEMTHLVLSPSWLVPPSIAGKEIGTKGMHKFEVSGMTDEAMDVGAALRSGKLRLRQPPGPKNPLGGVKFMFPNPFAVYLHDTSSRQLFTRSQRSLSHGCVRVGKPLELAVYLLADQPRWNQETISKAMRRGREAYVHLSQKMPVHLAYWTAWVDAEGVAQFRPDLYAVDATLGRVLARK
jgi:murein L,D-transpeptidase YcbB/YkuD